MTRNTNEWRCRGLMKYCSLIRHVDINKSFTLIHLHFCVQCRQKVQTLQTSDSVSSLTHINALKCETSLQYCYINFPLVFCFRISSTKRAGVQRGSSSCPSPPLCLCWQSSACISHLSLLSWEPFLTISICSLVMLHHLKSPVQPPVSQTLRKQTKEKVTNYSFLWLRCN